MTEEQRRALHLLHRGLVRLRMHGFATGDETVSAIADALEVLPSLVVHPERARWLFDDLPGWLRDVSRTDARAGEELIQVAATPAPPDW